MKIFRYLWRDKVDLFLLIIVIFMVIGWLVNEIDFTGMLTIMMLYIIGVMFRMGTAMDLLDEHVTDPGRRDLLGLKKR